ncbi:histone H1-like [Vespa mandarinia]|uniref:histone H1-like n=1 Tax=Vespa mandarinia TaxID=7446 RepID=UPI00161D86AA|nr:histone H1-like [Vespa mandarinia]XP_035733114.1 histone H1-like [Vespa mandarinia]XP_035733115.1 histone H1-like [Vespa mandarinia]
MEDTATNSVNTTVESNTENVKPTPRKDTKAKAQRSKSSHPPTSKMVTAAIKELKDRKGSSLQAIKKYIVATYKVDGEKVAPFIRRYLKTAVSSGFVVQTKGKGASGSFKLSTEIAKAKPQRSKKKRATDISVEKKNAVANKPVNSNKKAKTSPKKTPETAKKSVDQKKATKVTSPKSGATKAGVKTIVKAGVKTAAAAANAAEKKTMKKTAAQAKTISKTKKTAKAPAAKTKTPKPKKATTNKATVKK